MKLYLVHCGYYETQISNGIFESHVNLVAAGESFEDAKVRVRQEPTFKRFKMHIDGIQEIEAVQGFRIKLEQDLRLREQNIVNSEQHRDL